MKRKKISKQIFYVCFILIIISIFSCNGRTDQKENQTQQKLISISDNFIEPPEETKKILNGMNIVLGNWWRDYNTSTFQPKNDSEEKRLEYRKWLLKEYEFSMQEKNIGGWGEITQLAITSIMAGKPAATVFQLQPDWALSLYRQNLLYPVSDSAIMDMTVSEPVPWNKQVASAFTFNNKSYAFFVGNSLSSGAIFWNKRLFSEAGLDPNLPYDLQKDGTWTWDKFLEISIQLTRDINNDGIIDIYAMPSDFSVDILDILVSSNGAMYIDRDENGILVNASNRPEFIEAIRFYMRLRDEGVMKPKPEGIHWDWFGPEFMNGNVAMRMARQHIHGDLRTMRDDWGMVLPPKGPRAKNYVVFNSENVMVIPARGFSKEQIDAILWAVRAWETPIDEDWRMGYYPNFRDRRAVDETIAMMLDQDLMQWRHHTQVPGFSTSGIAWELWNHDGEPAQLVESVSQQWNALIEDANKLREPLKTIQK